MKNLAGVAECDKEIRRELARSGIEVVDIEKGNTEVPYSVIGTLGTMTFRRAWYYWVVNCRVPLDVAKMLYTDPVGKTDIRVAGHCGCPAPEEWVEYIDERGMILWPNSKRPVDEKIIKLIDFKKYRFVDDLAVEGVPYITTYHIDSEIGLRTFVDIVRRHNLVPMEPILVELPKHMTAEQAAENFNAFLLGSLAFDNIKYAQGARRYGPHKPDRKWILDSSNDFWLREVEQNTVSLTCRYPGQYNVLKAMVALFQAKFPCD
ncbi:MAG: Ralstonia phage [Candidatus Parcubacteria bacterium]|jgi:hypothetical protein